MAIRPQKNKNIYARLKCMLLSTNGSLVKTPNTKYKIRFGNIYYRMGRPLACTEVL